VGKVGKEVLGRSTASFPPYPSPFLISSIAGSRVPNWRASPFFLSLFLPLVRRRPLKLVLNNGLGSFVSSPAAGTAEIEFDVFF